MCVCFGKSKIGVPAEKVVLLTRCRSQHEKTQERDDVRGDKESLVFSIKQVGPSWQRLLIVASLLMPCVCDLEHYIVVVGIIGAAGVIFRTIKGCTFRGYGSQRSKQQQGGLNGLPTKQGGERCSYILYSSNNNSELNVHMRRRSALFAPPTRRTGPSSSLESRCCRWRYVCGKLSSCSIRQLMPFAWSPSMLKRILWYGVQQTSLQANDHG